MRLALAVALLCIPSLARAQVTGKEYAAPLTDGLSIPGTSISTEFDARAVAFNAGGLALLRGPEAAFAVDEQDLGTATASGQGFGAYAGVAYGGDGWPRFGAGMGFEWLRPPRDALTPDPGEPFRFTLGAALGLGQHAGFGASWHHFHDDGVLEGVDAFDLGLAVRLHNYVGFGATLTDIATSPIGGVPVERRYAVEVTVRPFATDRLELTGGARIGEIRGDVEGWARAQVRLARGVYALGEVDDRELYELDELPSGPLDRTVREYRGTFGVELDFGYGGLIGTGTVVRDPTGHDHGLGGTLVARISSVGPPSVVPESAHVERITLSGDIDVRALTQTVTQLRRMARDRAVVGVLVTLDDVTAGWATLEELHDELAALHRAGKKVFVYMVYGTGKDYFVASAADRIYLDPAGGLRFIGMAGRSFYFRGLLDMVGISPEFEKIAEYKSAPEELTERGPTPLAAQMHAAVFDGLYAQWVAAIAAGRHLTPEVVKALADGGPYDAGQLARDNRLVDAVAPPDKVSELIAREVGGVGLGEPRPVRPDRWRRPKIAVIYVDGDISDGESKGISLLGQSLASAQAIIEALQTARGDPSIGAVILRIDSPGGSAVASELIAREVFATRTVKPILCSMSNYAASGGYFVAAGCDVIFAEPMTITGSIGIFTGKADLSGLMKRLGIDVVAFTHGAHADEDSWFRPYTPEERADVLERLRYMYSRFVGAVAEGRGLTKNAVDAIGRGHVYTGAQAAPIRLVDKLGGLGDAIDEAKRRMGLGPETLVELRELPKRHTSWLGFLAKRIGVHEAASSLQLPLLKMLLGELPASMLAEPNAPQARLPFGIAF